MNRSTIAMSLLLLAGLAGSNIGARKPASMGAEVELDKALVFVEWNSTADDFGIHFSWDGVPWSEMKVENDRGRTFLAVNVSRNLRAQGLTEGFFESAEPPTSVLSMEAFFERFPEGEYAFEGVTLDGAPLLGEAEFSHVMPKPPTNLSPDSGDVVDPDGFTLSFDPVTKDLDGNAIDIAYYEVVLEKEDDEPILQTFTVILRPSVHSVEVPEAFLEPDTEYKFEVIAVIEGGNRTITESGIFSTDD